MIFVERRSLPTDEGRLTKRYSARSTQVRSCGLPKLWFSAVTSWQRNSPRRKIQHVRVRDFAINSALLLWMTLVRFCDIRGDVTSARRSLGSRRSERGLFFCATRSISATKTQRRYIRVNVKIARRLAILLLIMSYY